MLLSRISLENFLSFKNLDLELRPLNVLVGPNAAGKSNFIRSFELLQSLPKRAGISGLLSVESARSAEGNPWSAARLFRNPERLRPGAWNHARRIQGCVHEGPERFRPRSYRRTDDEGIGFPEFVGPFGNSTSERTSIEYVCSWT